MEKNSKLGQTIESFIGKGYSSIGIDVFIFNA